MPVMGNTYLHWTLNPAGKPVCWDGQSSFRQFYMSREMLKRLPHQWLVRLALTMLTSVLLTLGHPCLSHGLSQETENDQATSAHLPVTCPPQKTGQAAHTGVSSHIPRGKGHGTFKRLWGTRLTTAAGKSLPIAADLNRDGRIDIAVNGRGMRDAGIYMGKKGGGFADVHFLSAGGGGWGIDLGDVNGDGQPDIAIGDHLEGAGAWINHGGGSFAAARTGLPQAAYGGVGLADLNGDSHLDILLGADQFHSGFQVAFGDGAESWSLQVTSGLPGYDVQTADSPINIGNIGFADYDCDGDLDLFAFGVNVSTGTFAVYVYRNTGDGVSWQPVAQYSQTHPTGAGNPVQGSVGDINGDGHPDIVLGGTIFIFNTGQWQLATELNTARIGHLADMNGDHRLDLLTHGKDTGLRLYLGDGTGHGWQLSAAGLPDAQYIAPESADRQVITKLAAPFGIDVVDVDGEGTLAIIRTYQLTFQTHIMMTSPMTILEVWGR